MRRFFFIRTFIFKKLEKKDVQQNSLIYINEFNEAPIGIKKKNSYQYRVKLHGYAYGM
jgi:hypothetical protein